MSVDRTDEWREGYRQGAQEVEGEILDWLTETIDEWRELRVYSHEELWGAAALLAELRQMLGWEERAPNRGAE